MTRHKEIAYQRYNPQDGSTATLESLVRCYHNVFADPPWNEWYRCHKCGRHWGRQDEQILHDQMKLEHCGQKLELFWPHETVKRDLLHEITELASCWIALLGDEVVGFSWGYPIKVSDLEAKLDIPLTPGLREMTSDVIVAYHDDIGVASEHRGRGIAKMLFLKTHHDFANNGMKVVTARIKERPEPSVTYDWFVKLGYSVVARYPEDDGRAVLAQRIELLR